jgi:CubicO group peptidase (beta-lactamase class C family)
VIPNRAQGYAFAGGTHWNDRFLSMSQPGAAGVLISTAGDLVRWQRALVTGQVLSPESYLEMTTPFLLNDGRETAYGMGVQLDAVAGEPCVWHGGGIHGFNSVLLHFPRVDLSIAVISNSEGLRAGPLGMELAEALLAKR